MTIRTTFTGIGGGKTQIKNCVKLTFNVSTANSELALPFTGGSDGHSWSGGDIIICWGDGTVETKTVTGPWNHTYASTGTYEVIIYNANGYLPYCYTFQSSATTPYTNFKSYLYAITYSDITWKPSVMGSMSTFSYGFYDCTSLTTIPSDLFKYNTEITRFSNCFYNCRSLTSIPAELFRYNTAVTSFESCFGNCSSLTSIPAELFRYNTAVTNFSNCFAGCIKLTSIPAELFRYNTAVTRFNYCFYYCSKAQLNSTIFGPTSEMTTRFTSVSSVIYFTQCFYRTSYTNSNQGTAPELWNYTFNTTPTTTNCFSGAGNSTTSLSNYSSIPSAWGGPSS